MTRPVVDRPSIPLTWGEQDAFYLLMEQAAFVPRTVRYYTPRARLRLIAQRIARSPLAADLRAAWRSAFWPAVLGAGLFLGLFLTVATRGTYLDWSGFHPIPTGGTR